MKWKFRPAQNSGFITHVPMIAFLIYLIVFYPIFFVGGRQKVFNGDTLPAQCNKNHPCALNLFRVVWKRRPTNK